jgi:hypothetical protein
MKLNQDQDKTKYGKEWNARGVRRILVNPLYCGVLINHKYEIEDFLTGRQVAIPEEDRFYHQRPEWAIISPERFRRAQEILASRQRQYDSGEPFRDGRYSGKHAFSTLIKCAHCGRSFTRKSYTYKNTRVYWRCVTNDQYTAEKCDNGVILDEKELLDQIKQYFSSLIGDQEAFISRVLSGLDKQLPGDDPEKSRKDIEAKQKRLLQKRSRYQEMYANDLISLEELKEKLAGNTEELRAVDLDLEQIALAAQLRSNAEEITRYYRREIQRFLERETVTNVDMRRLIDHITVTQDGNVHVVLRKFEEMP